jgi:hypothetical protein
VKFSLETSLISGDSTHRQGSNGQWCVQAATKELRIVYQVLHTDDQLRDLAINDA